MIYMGFPVYMFSNILGFQYIGFSVFADRAGGTLNDIYIYTRNIRARSARALFLGSLRRWVIQIWNKIDSTLSSCPAFLTHLFVAIVSRPAYSCLLPPSVASSTLVHIMVSSSLAPPSPSCFHVSCLALPSTSPLPSHVRARACAHGQHTTSSFPFALSLPFSPSPRVSFGLTLGPVATVPGLWIMSLWGVR